MSDTAFLVGINHPWQKYGWDLGPEVRKIKYDPSYSNGGGRWDSALPSSSMTVLDYQLKEYKKLGIEVVRWIILGDGWNLGTPKYEAGKWSYNPPNLAGSSFCSDFAKMLAIFARNKMRLLPALINHLFLYPAALYLGKDSMCRKHAPTMEYDSRFGSIAEFIDRYFKDHPLLKYDETQIVDWTKFIKGGKRAILQSEKSRRLFLQNILVPLLDVSANYRAQIYAWELFSEPDLAIHDNYAAAKDMYDLLTQGCALIIKSNFKASIGFQLQENWRNMHSQAKAKSIIDFWTTQKVFVPQIHIYPDKDKQELGSGDSVAIVGEFSMTTKERWLNETDSTATLTNRLSAIKSAKFVAAFPWSAYGQDQYWDWRPQVQQELKAFIGAQ